MPGRLGIDFGTSNSVMAVWDETQQEGIPFHLPDFGRYDLHDSDLISVIPSLIHYGTDNQRWIGGQVIEHGVYNSEHTFKLMKRYITDRNPRYIRISDRRISALDAGSDFLSALLTSAVAELNLKDEEVVLTVPVESFEHYESWLTEIAESSGTPRVRVIDEPSAAALGYGAQVQPGNIYLVFDFGGGTLDVALVLIEEDVQALAGRRCRVLGKAGMDVGGSKIDEWLFMEVLNQNDRHDSDDDVRQLSRSLIVECERAKERLSTYESADISVMDPDTGLILSSDFTRNTFEDLLNQYEFYTNINRTIRRALNDARERGYTEDDIASVLMVGGSSLIPSVQKTVQTFFGQDRVLLHRPLDAVARGAAAFASGIDFYDHIQHDYAIRWLNREKGDYDYKVIVKRGTPYPTDKNTPLSINASYDGQIQLGIAIFEIGERSSHTGKESVEIVYDLSGSLRLSTITSEEEDKRTHFWINENMPTFLQADPPANKGESRFIVEFGINENKQLTITAQDTATNRVLYQDYPVVKLS
jgi:molecular chaperone DnaK